MRWHHPPISRRDAFARLRQQDTPTDARRTGFDGVLTIITATDWLVYDSV